MHHGFQGAADPGAVGEFRQPHRRTAREPVVERCHQDEFLLVDRYDGAGRAGGQVLGVHPAGPHVPEMIAESRLIVGRDAEPADAARQVHAPPTLPEAVGEVFLTLAGHGLHQQ